MRFAVIAYGDKKAWLPMFCKFYASFIASNPGSVITVVTGGERPWSQRDVFGVPVLQINTSDSAITKSNLNMSGILMAHAAMRLSSVLVMTLDCDVKKQIQEGYWSRSDIAVGDDPATRIWMMGDREIEEKNVAVQWCGSRSIGQRFLALWDQRVQDRRAFMCPFWEQVVWSEIFWTTRNRSIYPKELNWSHRWGPDNQDAIVVHRHGKSKWMENA